MKVYSRFPSSGLCALVAAFLVPLFTASALAAATTPDFGSPDELASRRGTFDIIGMKLGMPAEDALKALKAYDPKIQIGPQSGAFQVLPDMEITPAYVADEMLNSNGTYDRYHTAPERFLLLTTMAPGKAYV